MKTIKRIGALSLAVVLAVGCLSGCKKEEEGPTKEELQMSLNQALMQVQTLQGELQGAKEVLATYNPTLSDVDMSAITLLPTSQQAYTSINGKIRLSSQLTMTPSISLPNTTEILLGGDIKYIPSNNWTFELDNNVVRLQHKNGMIVSLKVYNYAGSSTAYDVMDTLIRPHLSKLAVKEESAKKAFINNSVVGGIITSTMKVKSYGDSGSILLENYIEEPVIPETVAETEAIEPETDEAGNIIETESTGEDNGEQVDESVAVSYVKPDSIPASGFGSLDDLSTNEGESSSEVDGAVETQTETQMETQSQIQSQPQTVEANFEVQDYKYVVGVVFSGDYALTIEVFYRNDENTAIQEELFNTCLSSITLHGSKLATE